MEKKKYLGKYHYKMRPETVDDCKIETQVNVTAYRYNYNEGYIWIEGITKNGVVIELEIPFKLLSIL